MYMGRIAGTTISAVSKQARTMIAKNIAGRIGRSMLETALASQDPQPPKPGSLGSVVINSITLNDLSDQLSSLEGSRMRGASRTAMEAKLWRGYEHATGAYDSDVTGTNVSVRRGTATFNTPSQLVSVADDYPDKLVATTDPRALFHASPVLNGLVVCRAPLTGLTIFALEPGALDSAKHPNAPALLRWALGSGAGGANVMTDVGPPPTARTQRELLAMVAQLGHHPGTLIVTTTSALIGLNPRGLELNGLTVVVIERFPSRSSIVSVDGPWRDIARRVPIDQSGRMLVDSVRTGPGVKTSVPFLTLGQTAIYRRSVSPARVKLSDALGFTAQIAKQTSRRGRSESTDAINN